MAGLDNDIFDVHIIFGNIDIEYFVKLVCGYSMGHVPLILTLLCLCGCVHEQAFEYCTIMFSYLIPSYVHEHIITCYCDKYVQQVLISIPLNQYVYRLIKTIQIQSLIKITAKSNISVQKSQIISYDPMTQFFFH